MLREAIMRLAESPLNSPVFGIIINFAIILAGIILATIIMLAATL